MKTELVLAFLVVIFGLSRLHALISVGRHVWAKHKK